MNDNFLTIFQQILDAKETVRFSNTYYGMTVNYEGTVLEVRDYRVFFQAPKPQLLCMAHSWNTFIENKRFPGLVEANVRALDVERGIVVLADFTHARHPVGNRSYVRIELQEMLRAFISPKDTRETFTMSIIEISIKGLAVVTHVSQFDIGQYGPNYPVSVTYKLPFLTENQPYTLIKYNGLTKDITLTKNRKSYRIGIQTFPDTQTELIITRFIAARQRDLCKEIKIKTGELPSLSRS